MFVGHAQDCAGDNYCMYVPRSNAIQTSRNVQWMKRMHYRQPVQEPVGTINSIELMNRAGVIGRIQGSDQHQSAARTNKEPTKDGMGEDKNKEDTNTIPKEVRFNLPKGEGMEQDKKGKVGDSKTGNEEVEIKFVSKHPQQDDMSALSRSIGKQWEDDKSMIVWETNDNGLGLDNENSELEGMQNKEPSNNTDHKLVKELQEKLRDRESEDTDSME